MQVLSLVQLVQRLLTQSWPLLHSMKEWQSPLMQAPATQTCCGPYPERQALSVGQSTQVWLAPSQI
jgi:hypothetical protein